MYGCMDGMDGRLYGCMDGCMYGYMDVWMDRWIDRQMDAQMEGWMVGWLDGSDTCIFSQFYILIYTFEWIQTYKTKYQDKDTNHKITPT